MMRWNVSNAIEHLCRRTVLLQLEAASWDMSIQTYSISAWFVICIQLKVVGITLQAEKRA
jgi:hypothetical protein